MSAIASSILNNVDTFPGDSREDAANAKVNGKLEDFELFTIDERVLHLL
jgi:hypothetical protein